MGSAGTLDPALLAPPAPFALGPADLALFVLNVGDGDALVLRFPDDGAGQPAYAVVDAFDGDKAVALLRDLGATRLRLVCATHPHFDHVKDLRAVLRAFNGNVAEFWDSGFRFTSATYKSLIEEVERQRIPFIRPTSGFETYLGAAQLTVLSPSIYLRNRYDTYGVDVNNASIVLRIAYPERPPSTDYPAPAEVAARRALPDLPTRTIILGADAQTDAWGRVLDEFPHLAKDSENWARAIGVRTGRQPLACDLFKVSHHGSKRGIDLELIERMGDRTGSGPSDGPAILVTSSASDAGSGYGFPHLVTQELLREVRDPLASLSAGTHKPDGALGIHHTAQLLAGGGPAGSIGFVVGADGGRALYRFGDEVGGTIDFTAARRVKGLR
jgi:beta-lactamase superfamily II metal-dependent hydrolase